MRVDPAHPRPQSELPEPLTVFFSAGEPSGDLHGATLLQELRSRYPRVLATGFGGPRLSLAGCHLQADLTQFAVMWFSRPFAKLPQFIHFLKKAERIFRTNPPAAVVLIDYPGFNWWVASRGKALWHPRLLLRPAPDLGLGPVARP